MKSMRTTLECPKAGRGSGKPTLESRGSSREEKGESRNIPGTQRHGCGILVPYARTDLAAESCPRYSGQGPLDDDTSFGCPNHNTATKWVITECCVHRPVRGGLGWDAGVPR